MTDERRPATSASATSSTADAGNGSTGATRHSSGAALHLELPADVVSEIVDQVANRLSNELAEASPWMTRQEAAAYLRWPTSRLEKRRDVPHVKDEGRVMYHRPTLDQWMLDRTEQA